MSNFAIALDARVQVVAVLVLTTMAACGSALTIDEVRRGMPDVNKTRLMLASGAGDIATVRRAFEQGEDINAVSEDSFTALHYAAANGRDEVIDLLIERGADPNAQTDFMYTPLHLAVFQGNEEIVAQLVHAKVNLNLKDVFGKTPLHYAVATSGTANTLLLLQSGAFVLEASTDPRDLRTTASSYRALGTLRSNQGKTAEARQALENAARYYDRADEGFTALREQVEVKLHRAAIQTAALSAALVLAGAAADVGASYQARRQAMQLAQISALRKASKHGGGPAAYNRYYAGYKNDIYERTFADLEARRAAVEPTPLDFSAIEGSSMLLEVLAQEAGRAATACDELAKECRTQAAAIGKHE